MRGRYSPINPVALSTAAPAPTVCEHITPVVSVAIGGNSNLIEEVGRLWIKPADVIADVTYGRGAMWQGLKGLRPTYTHDIALDGVDCRSLPHPDSSIDVVVLDPPYRPTHGSRGFATNGLASAYGLGSEELDTINDVLALYRDAITEAARVVRDGGRLLLKCQDLSYGHRLHLVSLDVLRLMVEAGFEFADQFILVNRNQLSSGAWEKQERARRVHSILWVGLRVCN